MLERFLLLWLVLSSLLAYYWTSFAALLGPWAQVVGDPFQALARWLPWLITVTMFAIGWLLPVEEVKQVGRRWPTVLAGTALQYTSMPSLAMLMAWLLGLEGEALIGMILVGCVPGAMASNVLTVVARGNTSYSVSLTTLATLLSPIAVPLALRVFLAEAEDVNTSGLWKQAAVSLCFTVVLPVLAGFSAARALPRWNEIAQPIGRSVANLTILAVIAAVVAVNRERLAGISPRLLTALLLLNLCGYLAGWVGGWTIRLPAAMRRALTLEIGMQNAGLGAMLAVQLFPTQPGAAIAPAMYTFGCMLTGTLLARIWALLATRDTAEPARAEEFPARSSTNLPR